MRTTLTIDDDVLAAARALAVQQGRSVGEVISTLMRRALSPASPHHAERNGVPLLPTREAVAPVTPHLVNQLRDELP